MSQSTITILDQPIIAHCTPQGSGAIALLRLSGIRAFAIADTISWLPKDKKLSQQASHTIHYGYVIDAEDNHLDQVLFLCMQAPHTFTGDDTVEITCHNNPFIIQHIISVAIAAGARMAQEGEFSRRAVENNKIDMLQAEAINDLIHANTQLALKQSLSQVEGSFTEWIITIEKQLIKALAFSEASFEFLDEEDMRFGQQIKEIITDLKKTITQLKRDFNEQQHIRNGIRIAIIGSVNAGKSSLFNALLNKERAIVTEIAGTTRDAIEAGLYKNGNYWTLIDTAGLRMTDDIIEQMGIAKSYEESHKADIILLVCNGAQTLSSQEASVYQELLSQYHDKMIVVVTKADLPSHDHGVLEKYTKYAVSSRDRKNIDLLEHAIQAKIDTLFSSMNSPFLLNQRHFNALTTLENNLIIVEQMLTCNAQYELISYHLTDALSILSELTGKTISQAGMDAVFREFCVGK
jgi:tRNA modification GTPase